MIRARIAGAAAAGAVAIVSTLALSHRGAAEMPIRAMMGENFTGMQTILVALIRGDYQAVPGQVDIIRAHAEELTHAVPESVKEERVQFLAYATNLSAHAQDLKTIAESLMVRDSSHAPGIDYLREALAAHYGGMVTTCVACHNRFRPQKVE